MTADLLRRAAAKIRETTNRVDPGAFDLQYLLDGGMWRDNAAHAAMWSPDAAGDVAAWLENEAHFLDAAGHPLFPAALRPDHPALRLARRILGERP